MGSHRNNSHSKIDDFIVLISNAPKKSFLGAGFVVQCNLDFFVITATHVITDTLGIPRDTLRKSVGNHIDIFFPQENTWGEAELTNHFSEFENDDIAILKIASIPQNIIPAQLASSQNANNHKFTAAGIREAGTRAQGVILGHELLPRNPSKKKRLELLSANIDGGMSGSPILDETNHFVVGMIVSTWHTSNSKDQFTAYGATAEAIGTTFSDLLVISPDALDYRLAELATKIIYQYENPANEKSLIFGIDTGNYIDMSLWEYGVEYVDETRKDFAWLSEDKKEAARKKGLISDSAITYLLSWGDTPSPVGLVILAEFGMGKSTLLKRFEYLLSLKFLKNSSIIPIRFPLGYKSNNQHIDDALIEQVKMFILNEYHIIFTSQELNSILESNKGILLLDSFDEMSASPTPGTQSLGLNHIVSGLRGIKNLKIVIASRDNYFYGNGDIRELFKNKDPFFPTFDFETVYLRGFNQKEIKLYLETRLQDKAKNFWDELQKIHDLPDLARRPILLLMMTILEKEVIAGDIRTRHKLYQEFVRVWLKRERINGRIRLSDEVILQTLNMLAELASLDKGRTFRQEEIDKLLVSKFSFTQFEAENLGADFKVCCFLGRNQNDDYKFLHESFREYFFAATLIKYLSQKKTDIFRKTFISVEVSRFMLENISNSEHIIDFLKPIIKSETGADYLLTNATMLYELLTKDQNDIYSFYETLPTNRAELTTNHTPPKNFIVIPSGSFLMGTWQGRPDETPIHQVKIGEFLLCKYTVTNFDFLEFVNATNYVTEAEKLGEGRVFTGNEWQVIKGLTWRNPRPDNLGIDSRLNHPVTQVSWHDAAAYCEWRSHILGLTVELPSESEWEYACRAGSMGKWCFGNNENLLMEYGWYQGNKNSITSTQPVGQKKPNKWGLYDMHGNVREWCADVYEKYPGNNLNWDLGNRYFSISGKPLHVLRGGHFGSVADFLRSSVRVSAQIVNLSTDYTGFRLKIKL